jgi:hypothetical protein
MSIRYASPLDLSGNPIHNVADPTSAQDVATQAYVLARIAALVNAAPGTLDTLAELASALGNDSNFAATMVAAIEAAKDRANHIGTQASTTISDFATAVDARISAAGADYYAATIGDGSATSFTVTHNLGTRDVLVGLREVNSPYDHVGVQVSSTTTNTVTLTFGAAPSAGQYRVMVRRAG